MDKTKSFTPARVEKKAKLKVEFHRLGALSSGRKVFIFLKTLKRYQVAEANKFYNWMVRIRRKLQHLSL